MFTPSARSQVPPFLVMDVMEAADRAERSASQGFSGGRRVLHLEVGQPETPAPAVVRRAARAALDSDRVGYSRATGTPALRDAIAQHYKNVYSVEVSPESVVVTSGASGAFVLAFIAAFSAGSRVALSVPGYPCYANILRSLDLVPSPIRVGKDSGYRLTISHLESLESPPAGLIIASPANPTGSMLRPSELRDLLAYCRAKNIFAIVDEIYHGLEFSRERTSTAAEFPESTIVIGSFSKYYSMTGWRLGWMLVPKNFRRTIEILSQNLTICPPTLSQLAAVHAFDAKEELEGHVLRYRRNRDVLSGALRRAGVTDVAPADGAFYIYADISAFSSDSRELCTEMLEQIQVAATPGVDFDPEQGQRAVRFSYCRGEDDIREAAERLEAFLKAKQSKRVADGAPPEV